MSPADPPAPALCLLGALEGLGAGPGSWLKLSGRGARTPMTGGASGVGCGVCADDHARIKLKVESSPSRSDYINASPIVSGPHLLPVFILPP